MKNDELSTPSDLVKTSAEINRVVEVVSRVATAMEEKTQVSTAISRVLSDDFTRRIDAVGHAYQSLAKLGDLSHVFSRLDGLASVNLQLTKLCEAQLKIPNELGLVMQRVNEGMKAWDSISRMHEIASNFGRIESLYAVSTSFSAIGKLSAIHQAGIGAALNFNAHFTQELSRTLDTFTDGYQGLLNGVLAPEFPDVLKPFVQDDVQTELFREATAYESISLEEESGEDIEISEVEPDRLLESIDPAFVEMLRGIRYIIRSNGPDRVRHLSASARELLTHLIHHLAPDEKVKAWSINPEHYHNNRPTRRARLLYIYRDVNCGCFSEFIATDIGSVLKFMEILQKGMHEKQTDLNDHQLECMVQRLESFLSFLLRSREATR
ncbi:hypothetical protein H5P28_00660 [Ruficoccus amylovorans]|uniref:Predicted pPIWI-associating nuclease domain-containing protein n=1 Tax=Ruficoccus amylovorans TaxID=1804625 RepID=A0A842HBF7_9BACT|nr:hypothetical protein [Ruficoccus amylovorans]MBC2592761.1 hypothetical protein [Ruficoccus amylovorans]